MSLMIPTDVAIDILGAGRSGSVFRCSRTRDQELVAIKIFRKDDYGRHGCMVERNIYRLLASASNTGG